MPKGVSKVESGRLMSDRGQLILLRDDGGCWGLFFERIPHALLGQRVTVRGARFGFGMIHVTDIAQGADAPSDDRRTRFGDLLLAALFALSSGVLAVSLASTIWSFAAGFLG